MSFHLNYLAPGYAIAPFLVLILFVIALRLDEERAQPHRNHVAIVSGSLAAFSLVLRLLDVLTHPWAPRWSALIVMMAMFFFLASDQIVARRFGKLWQRLTGRTGRYTGPDRRRPPESGEKP